MKVRLWHGSQQKIESFDASLSRDGGLHFGSKDQATMRNRAWLHEVEVEITLARRCKDTGYGWADKIASARAAGYSSIVYLNRYEGFSSEVIERLAGSGDLSKLDGMTDAEVRKLVPEATDSFIIFDASLISILNVERWSAPNKQEELPDQEDPAP